MDHEATLKRIIKKLGVDPTTPVERCLPWPTKSKPRRPGIRTIRAYDGGSYMAPYIHKNRTRLMVKGEILNVPRTLHMIMANPTGPFVATQRCRTPFCVNPQHYEISEALPK